MAVAQQSDGSVSVLKMRSKARWHVAGLGCSVAFAAIGQFAATPAGAQQFRNSAPIEMRRQVGPSSLTRSQQTPVRKQEAAARVIAQRSASRARSKAAKSDRAKSEKRAPKIKGELLAIVSLSSQRITVYDGGGEVMSSRVSTGKAGHRTPKGIFSILQKRRYHESNLYSNAPMPFMQRLTWSGIALHAGVVPGYPASHGCIRLPPSFASRLFGMSKMGMRVVVAPHGTRAFPISHPALPVPIMVAVPVNGSDHRAIRQGAIQVATADSPTTDALQPGTTGLQAVATRLMNPLERAQAERAKAKQEANAAADAAKAALQEARETAEMADEERERLDELRSTVAEAQTRFAQAVAAEAAAKPEAKAAAAEERMAARIHLADMQRAFKEARGFEAALRPASFEAAVASRKADEVLERAKAEASEAALAVNNAAVFISRKTGKLYIRQGFAPTYEAPVGFRSPDRPVGTHLFMAMAADDASGKLSWMSVTVPESEAAGRTTRRPVKRGQPGVEERNASPASAAEVLDRLIVAPKVMREVADRLWAGGSIIISDHGISNETGKFTDFIVLTR